MTGPDRRHAVAVARRVEAAGYGDRPVMAAALLHDVGKIVAGVGTFGRVAATTAAMLAGRERASGWSEGAGLARRAGLYVRHDELGAGLLTRAGSDELTVRWAREHHLPADRWSVPADVGQALKAADDD
jgi:predicted HD phosphohydrolase